MIDLATFQALIGPAFNANAGGVVNVENTNGSLDDQDIIAKFGVGTAKSLTISSISGIINSGSSVKEGRTPISGVNRLAKTDTANTTIDFGGVLAKYVKLTIDGTWGTAPQSGLSEVRFLCLPVQAREPRPPAAGTGVGLDVLLNWRPGREAALHKVYFDTDPQAVTDGTAAAQTVIDHRFRPPALRLSTTYYWRVDEANEAAATPSWAGEVWSFTTADYMIVEDFESYTDNEGNRIYEIWADGFGSSDNGSQVGNTTAPFAEQTIIHGGRQSMPLSYHNAGAIALSEAVRMFETPQDWTAGGIRSLSLYFQGAAGNTGQLYLKINNAKVPYSGAPGDLATPDWMLWNIDLSTVGGLLTGVTRLTIGIEGSDAKGTIYLDDIRLYP